MKTINLKQILETKGLSVNEVSKQLFPGNKHPRLALNRVMAGDAVLDADQISKLSALAGMTIDELYGTKWVSSSNEGIVTFTTDTYSAVLDPDTWITKIFDNDTLFHESVIHSSGTPLKTYLTLLNDLIENHKNKSE